MKLTVSKSGPLNGTVRPPSNKSITHRAYIFAGLAEDGPSIVRSPLMAEDCEATLKIMQSLGCTVERGEETVKITPPAEFVQPRHDLDCGNSGTTMRLIAGVLAAAEGIDATLIGDASLSRRPMQRIIEPLLRMGAQIEGDTAPLKIIGKQLKAISYESPVASAQIKSCILFAGLKCDGVTWVREPCKSRDHTERFLQGLGVEVLQDCDLKVGVRGGSKWGAFDVTVSTDISSAAFFLCAGAMIQGSDVTLTEVGVNPTRTGVIDVLKSAGAKIENKNDSLQMGEPVTDLRILCYNQLEALEVSGDLVPRLIDEIPVLAVLATQCHGTTKFRDAKGMRVKESERIEVVAEGLRRMGADVMTYEDGLSVNGPVRLKGAEIDAAGDHRIGMAFAIAGLVAEGETTILNADSIRTSYPEFEQHLRVLSASQV